MLLAADNLNKKLIVGLQNENIQRLLNDQPIQKSLDDISELKGWTLYILGPEDMERFVAHFNPNGMVKE